MSPGQGDGEGRFQGGPGSDPLPKEPDLTGPSYSPDSSATYAHGLSLHGRPEPRCQLIDSVSAALRREHGQLPLLVSSLLGSRPDPRGGG